MMNWLTYRPDTGEKGKTMDKQEIMQMLGEWFGIEPDEETGEYDINDYDWQSGCYMNGKWFSLAEIVNCLEANL